MKRYRGPGASITRRASVASSNAERRRPRQGSRPPGAPAFRTPPRPRQPPGEPGWQLRTAGTAAFPPPPAPPRGCQAPLRAGGWSNDPRAAQWPRSPPGGGEPPGRRRCHEGGPSGWVCPKKEKGGDRGEPPSAARGGLRGVVRCSVHEFHWCNLLLAAITPTMGKLGIAALERLKGRRTCRSSERARLARRVGGMTMRSGGRHVAAAVGLALASVVPSPAGDASRGSRSAALLAGSCIPSRAA